MRAPIYLVARRAAFAFAARGISVTPIIARTLADSCPQVFLFSTKENFHDNIDIIDEVNKNPEETPFAVDGPDGQHDLEDEVRFFITRRIPPPLFPPFILFRVIVILLEFRLPIISHPPPVSAA